MTSTPSPRLLLVAAALLVAPDNTVMIAQRPPGKAMAGLWEFPGGKLEAGESPEAALARELHEEVGIIVQPHDFTPLTFASHSYSAFHLLMPLFSCRTWQGTPTPREGQTLAWVSPHELTSYDFVPADIPLLGIIQKTLTA